MRDPRQRRFIVGKDLLWLVLVPILAMVAWTVSDRACERLARALAWASAHARPGRATADAAKIAGVVGRAAGAAFDPAAALDTLKANYHLRRLQIFRYHRPGGWAPQASLRGQSHIEDALAAGKGVVLYVLPSVWNPVVTKQSLHEAGYRVSHLSRPDHGFSDSRFGIAVINPIQTAAERRYLQERVIVDPDGGTAALRELTRRLHRNQIVSINAGSQAARTHVLPFLDGAIRLAGGPAALALQTGAALLPISTIRNSNGSFTTSIEAPIPPPDCGERSARVEAMLRQCAAYMEAFAATQPGQFGDWADTLAQAAVSAVQHGREPRQVARKLGGPAVT